MTSVISTICPSSHAARSRRYSSSLTSCDDRAEVAGPAGERTEHVGYVAALPQVRPEDRLHLRSRLVRCHWLDPWLGHWMRHSLVRLRARPMRLSVAVSAPLVFPQPILNSSTAAR